MTQPACESMKLRREAATDSQGRCTATLPGSQTIESRSRYAKPSRVARAFAYVLFLEPELPKTRTFMRPNEKSVQSVLCLSQREQQRRPSTDATIIARAGTKHTCRITRET